MNAGIVAASDGELERIANAVHFTEEYKDRVKGLFTDYPATYRPTRSSQPVRGILLQNVYEGKDGAIQLIGRDNINKSFYLEIVGRNPKVSANTFSLRLSGMLYNDAGELGEPIVIGESSTISCISTAYDLAQAMYSIDRVRLNEGTLSIGLGNPLFDNSLEVYGDVVPANIEQETPASCFLGAWYINFPQQLFPYDALKLEVPLEGINITGLTQIRCTETLDLLSPEVTLATDIDYRTKDYPWQAGTIATCLDFGDVGYGIIRSTSRIFELM